MEPVAALTDFKKTSIAFLCQLVEAPYQSMTIAVNSNHRERQQWLTVKPVRSTLSDAGNAKRIPFSVRNLPPHCPASLV